MTRRLIDKWFPVAAVGAESVRERRVSMALPPPFHLHVWWARRPLVASRAAILAVDADRDRFPEVSGIRGDPVAARRRIERAGEQGSRFEGDPYGYPRSFTYTPGPRDLEWIRAECARVGCENPVVLDPMAGGGSIPLEAVRLGSAVLANDLDPVAGPVLRATVEWPLRHGTAVLREFRRIARAFVERRDAALAPLYPAEKEPDTVATNWIWARTVTCPRCGGEIPLSPDWRLAPDGTGVRLDPDTADGPGSDGRVCRFEVVRDPRDRSAGTLARGGGRCPRPDCGEAIPRRAIRDEAREGRLGERPVAVVVRKRTEVRNAGGRTRVRFVRDYRAPLASDTEAAERTRGIVAAKLPEWEAEGLVPDDEIPPGEKTDEPRRYGIARWCDMFSPRRLLAHATAVSVYRELLAEEAARHGGELPETAKAAFGYPAIAIDRAIDYNARLCRWDSSIGRPRAVFDRHDFAFVRSHAEMSPLAEPGGRDWTIEHTAEALEKLVAMVCPAEQEEGDEPAEDADGPSVAVKVGPADRPDGVPSGSIDVIVGDPPYYGNVQYGELAGFFRVWLTRTVGRVFPEPFAVSSHVHESEAVANRVRFAGCRKAKEMASHDWCARMTRIFRECRRVLRPDGVMVTMFANRSEEGRCPFVRAPIDASFAIDAVWPVECEAPGSLHIRGRVAARATVLVVCRPRRNFAPGPVDAGRIGGAVRARMREFEQAGIGGPDLDMAAVAVALAYLTHSEEALEEGYGPLRRAAEIALGAADDHHRDRARAIARAYVDDPLEAWRTMAAEIADQGILPHAAAKELARSVGIDPRVPFEESLAKRRGRWVVLTENAHTVR